MRADAARNRAKVLTVAYETFATDGLSVPIDEVARRAGVGAGTVYRHFPTKQALIEAVIDDRIRAIVDDARAQLARDPGGALFVVLGQMIRHGAADQGLVDALTGYGVDIATAAPAAEAALIATLDDLLAAAQNAGTARTDVGVMDVKALLAVCKTAHQYGDAVSERVAVVIEDGLRSSRAR